MLRQNVQTGVIQTIDPLHLHYMYEALGRMSANGSRVFVSTMQDYRLPPGTWGLFVRDFRAGWVRRVDLNNGQHPENKFGRPDAVSADGHYVLFSSPATNLVGADTNGAWDVFARAVDLRRISRVSVSSGRRQANGTSLGLQRRRLRPIPKAPPPTLSAAIPTRYETSSCAAPRQAGTTRRCSISTSGVQANDWSGRAGALSRVRLWAFFLSPATNLVAGDTNRPTDLFARGPGC